MQRDAKTAYAETNSFRPRDNGQQERHARAALWWRKAGIWTAAVIFVFSMNFTSGTPSQNKDAGAFFRPKGIVQNAGEFFKPTLAYAQEQTEITRTTAEQWLRESGQRQSFGYVLYSSRDRNLPDALRQQVLRLEQSGQKPYICSAYRSELNGVSYDLMLDVDSALLVRYGENTGKIDLKPLLAGRSVDSDTLSQLSENAKFVPVNVRPGELPEIWIADEGMGIQRIRITTPIRDLAAAIARGEVEVTGTEQPMQLIHPVNPDEAFKFSNNFCLFAVTAKDNPGIVVVVAYDAVQRSGKMFVFCEGSEWSMLFGPDAGSNPQVSDISVSIVKIGSKLYVVAQDLTSITLIECPAGQNIMQGVASFPR